MAAKKITKTTRTSPKQLLAAYKERALSYIQTLRNPVTRPAFSITTYTVTPTGKKATMFSAPELGAIVGTAGQLGKEIRVKLSGSGDDATLYFQYVDVVPNIPGDLF